MLSNCRALAQKQTTGELESSPAALSVREPEFRQRARGSLLFPGPNTYARTSRLATVALDKPLSRHPALRTQAMLSSEFSPFHDWWSIPGLLAPCQPSESALRNLAGIRREVPFCPDEAGVPYARFRYKNFRKGPEGRPRFFPLIAFR